MASAPEYSILINGKVIPVVTNRTDIDLSKAMASNHLKSWTREMSKNPRLDVGEIMITDMDMFGPRVGFLKFSTNATFDGKKIPDKVFARGDSVGMLVVLENEEGKRFGLGVVQPRVPIGCEQARELPAGVVDEAGNFAGQAGKELKEECDMTVHETNMIDLIDKFTDFKGVPRVGGEQRKGFYPSMGGCDESMRIMFYYQKVTNATLAAMQGKATGVLAEGEMIKLAVVPIEQFMVWGIQDAKVVYAMALYNELHAAGVLP